MPTLAEIAALLSVPAPQGGDQDIIGIATLEEAEPGQISFVGSEQYLPHLAQSRASAVIVQRRVKVPPAWEPRALRVDDADLAVAQVLELFAPPVPRPPVGIDPTARVAPSALVGDAAAIGPYVVIGQHTRVGRGCVLHAGVYLGDNVTLGDHCELFPHVVVRERITLGHRVIIHAGSILGTDGFGYRWDGQKHAKVPQIGTVVVEDDVEIGSCVCIDRAKFSTTRIGRGTKIDNLVQIGHNVQVGPHCIIVGQAGLAGSSHLGAGVVLGGQTAVRDHTRIGDGAMAAACSGINKDVPAREVVSGTPALPHRQSLREQAALRRLPDLLVQIRRLQEQVDALTRADGPERKPSP